jgi:hypothetical protein
LSACSSQYTFSHFLDINGYVVTHNGLLCQVGDLVK